MSDSIDISYLSNERFPAYTACSMQQMRMCEAFAQTGARVRLVRPHYFAGRPLPKEKNDLFEFYGIDRCFSLVTLPSLLAWSKRDQAHTRNAWRLPFVGGLSQVAAMAAYLLYLEKKKAHCIYTRNVHAAWVCAQIKRATGRPLSLFFEAHAAVHRPERWFGSILRASNGVVALTENLKSFLCRNYGIAEDRILVAADAAVIKKPIPQSEARQRLGLTGTRDHWVVYTGSLQPGKGVEVLVRAAADLPDCTVIIVGGGIEHIQQIKPIDPSADVRFLGWIEPDRVWSIQCAADVLVLPNTDHPRNEFTSPLKLFEYLQCGHPLVVSDLPVLRRAMPPGRRVYWAKSGDPDRLARAIRQTLADACRQKIPIDDAFASETWHHRAEKIMVFIREKQE
ncbi:glycosyltransferase family 4 protein [candidate division KSB1 bacterium]|nr:glycosyltransferase family 4 protein [candidate division KSB1 bacterium]